MRILYVNTFYYPNMIGGTEKSVKLLADAFAQCGHSVALLTYDGNKKDIVKQRVGNVTVYRVKWVIPHSINGRKGSVIEKIINKTLFIHNSYIKNYINRVIEDFNPDIVHTNNLYRFSTLVWEIIQEKKIPIIHTIRDYGLLNAFGTSQLLSRVSRPLIRKRTELVSVVTAPSKFMIDSFVQFNYFSRARITCIENAVEVDLVRLKEIIEKRKCESTSHIRFLYVGMLVKKKGIYNLISAFNRISNDNIELIICGDGELEGFIREAVKRDRRIRYLGYRTMETMDIVYMNCDVLIVPSICAEAFGRVVIEGNNNGLPVIGANQGGIREIIGSINSGELYQFDRIEELEKMIVKFSNRKYIQSFYENILIGIEKYSLDNQVRRFNDIYEAMV